VQRASIASFVHERLRQVLLKASGDAVQSASKSAVAPIVEAGICPDEVHHCDVGASAEAEGSIVGASFTFAVALPPAQTVGVNPIWQTWPF